MSGISGSANGVAAYGFLLPRVSASLSFKHSLGVREPVCGDDVFSIDNQYHLATAQQIIATLILLSWIFGVERRMTLTCGNPNILLHVVDLAEAKASHIRLACQGLSSVTTFQCLLPSADLLQICCNVLYLSAQDKHYDVYLFRCQSPRTHHQVYM